MSSEISANMFFKMIGEHLNMFQNKLKGDKKEKLISQMNQIIKNPQSEKGYYKDIIQLLSEFDLTQKDYFNFCLKILRKSVKTKEENQIITGYLFLMKDFINLVSQTDSSHLYSTIYMISKHLEYEKYQRENIIMRYGETGKKAYVILSGKIDVLIKTSKKILVEESNYIEYLASLIRFREYEILNTVLNENFKTSLIFIIDDTNEDTPQWEYNMANKTIIMNNPGRIRRYNASELIMRYYRNNYFPDDKRKEKLIINRVSTDDYIKRYEIVNECTSWSESSRKRQFEATIYTYVKVISLHPGDIFGDIALSDPLAKRTATIISATTCHLGSLSKASYNLSLKQSAELVKRHAISFIGSFLIFSDIPLSRIQKNYFNNFSKIKLSKGDFIIGQYQKSHSMYLLYKGEYEIWMNASLKEISSILRYFYSKMKANTTEEEEKLEESEKQIEKEGKENPLLVKLYNKKNLIRISCLNPPEIIGLPNIFNDKTESFFNVQCKSKVGELYELSYIFYREMNSKEYSIRDNLREYLEKKYKILVERLNIIRNSSIKTLFDFQISNSDEVKNDLFSGVTKNKIYKTYFTDKIKDVKINKIRLTSETLPRVKLDKPISQKKKSTPKLRIFKNPTPKRHSKNTFSELQEHSVDFRNSVDGSRGASIKAYNTNPLQNKKIQSVFRKTFLETSELSKSNYAPLNTFSNSPSNPIKAERDKSSSITLSVDKVDRILRTEVLAIEPGDKKMKSTFYPLERKTCSNKNRGLSFSQVMKLRTMKHINKFFAFK